MPHIVFLQNVYRLPCSFRCFKELKQAFNRYCCLKYSLIIKFKREKQIFQKAMNKLSFLTKASKVQPQNKPVKANVTSSGLTSDPKPYDLWRRCLPEIEATPTGMHTFAFAKSDWARETAALVCGRTARTRLQRTKKGRPDPLCPWKDPKV